MARAMGRRLSDGTAPISPQMDRITSFLSFETVYASSSEAYPHKLRFMPIEWGEKEGFAWLKSDISR